ncbi:Uncharacterised protein [Mycobacterium tuberculosis]|nr:Uncharacterised protein [Mycobacterium tuberculosis]
MTQPHQRDGVAAVEQFGANTTRATLAIGFHATQGANHRDLLAALAVDRTLCAGIEHLVG